MYRRSLILLALVTVAVSAADAPMYNFDLAVRTGGGQVLHVMEALPAGSSKVVDVSSTLKFDLTTPSDGVSPTIVRLIDTSGAEPRVLHTARRRDSAEVRRSSTYTICREGVYFESPSPEVLVKKCKD
jgi:hypothetical protein